ncbi:MAG TPA: VOC family protein [Chloroflexota bacterium]|jgi:hypothetical protein|nr:VOC family protein [Chloroflexota bacterium]
MTSRFTELIIDAKDPAALARFWCHVLGYQIVSEEDDVVAIWDRSVEEQERDQEVRSGPVVPALVFVPVPEEKAVKVRIHIDVNPIDVTQEEEVERLIGLGARRVDVGQGDVSWVVLADPEGNEFCVLRSLK